MKKTIALLLICLTNIIKSTDNHKILPLFSNAKITVPELLGYKQENKEYINLDAVEPIVKEKFSDLIYANHQKKIPFILALVKTRVDNKLCRHYFSAAHLDNWLFNKDYDKDPQNNLNPITGSPINDKILYFKIKSLDDKFKYLCNSNDLFYDYNDYDLDSVYFYRNFIQGSQDDPQSQFEVGKYFFEKEKYHRAITWIKNSIRSPQRFSREALLIMASSYKKLNKYKKAKKCYLKCANDYSNSKAYLKLGKLYEKGLGVDQDYEEAANWYRLAAKRGNFLARIKLNNLERNNYIRKFKRRKFN